MIEITLELAFDSFLIHSVGGSGDPAERSPSKALHFTCKNPLSARKLTEDAPTEDFEFLGSASQHESKGVTAKGFDDQLFEYLSTHTTVDISSVTVSSEASGYSTMPKGQSTGEIGRITLTRQPNQSRMDIELVLKSDEFDAIWKLIAEREIRQVMATLACFELKQGAPPASSIVVGIASSSLRIVPHAGG